MLLPIIFIFVNPLIIGAKYYLRVANGSLLHHLMLQRIEGPKIYLSLFNITNPEDYMLGRDEKIKFNEVGPFVYQEYRINHDLVIDSESGVMRFTPEVWLEFIPEESYGHPKEVYLSMPCTPLLAGADMISKYPFFVRNLFNMLTASVHSKAIINTTAHDYLWGYNDPLLSMTNNIVPGLIYYNSSGILERMVDGGASYTMEVGIRDHEKFSVRRVQKFRIEKNMTSEAKWELVEGTQNFTDAYEGAVFPPEMSPDIPINIYRLSVCKLFPFTYTGTTKTKYNSEGFVYDLANSLLNAHELCDNTGFCPDGLIDISSCYSNFPFAISRGNFLDADPRIWDKFEGIKPDRELHSTKMVIDPRLGVTISSYISVQLNLFLGDLSFNRETRRFKNTVLPLAHSLLKHPRLPSQADIAFRVIYIYGPYILLISKLVCVLLGLVLLVNSARKFYLIWPSSNTMVFDTKNHISHAYMQLQLK